MDIRKADADLKARARSLLWRSKGRAPIADADDATQETFRRFYQSGLHQRIDPSRGSALSVLHGILGFVSLETDRACRRAARKAGSPGRSDAAPATIEAVLGVERFELIGEKFRELPEKEQTALLRVHGPLYGCCVGGKATSNDHVIAHRVAVKLRKWSKKLGLMD